jgi:hypothetical protein
VVIPSGPSEVEAEVFSGSLYPLSTMVFGGGRVADSDPLVVASRFPPLGGGDAPMVLPIPLAAAVMVVEVAVAAAYAASTMAVGLLDTVCASQSETRVSDVTANVGSRGKGDSPFYLRTCVTGATTINV